jgi:hypothetical protein
MLFLMIEEKNCHMDVYVENCSGFILINMGLHKFNLRHANQAMGFGNSIFRFSNNKNKALLLLIIEKINLYISTRQFEKFSGLITLTNQLQKFSYCNGKRTL